MKERLVFMQVEDGIAQFETESGDSIFYPANLMPDIYKEGDIILSVIHSEDFIEFFEVDYAEMRRREERVLKRIQSLRLRAKRSTNQA